MTSESGTERRSLPPERLSKDELYAEVIDLADLPEKKGTGSYPFRKRHLMELVRHLRTVEDDGLRADGSGETEIGRRDPAEDPQACSVCGVYIGFGDGEYCDGCAREIGAKPPLERCLHCGTRGPAEQMEPIDVSTPEEYYPQIRYLCRGCSGGESP